MKYFVTIGETTVVVDIDGDHVEVDGNPVAVDVESNPTTPELRVTWGDEVHRMAAAGQDGDVCRLLDQGTVYDITVEDERRRHIRLLAGAARTQEAASTLKAPMPGLVTRILVKVGDSVVPGTPLITLEAMKMENELKAAAPGVVTGVSVVTSQAVERGQGLLEIGPPAPPELTKTVAGG